MSTKRLTINRCPAHGWWSISVDDDGGGVRVTPSKCCGRWDEVKTFPLTGLQWQELARLAEEAAEESDAEPREGEASRLFSVLCAYDDATAIDQHLTVGDVRRAVRDMCAARRREEVERG